MSLPARVILSILIAALLLAAAAVALREVEIAAPAASIRFRSQLDRHHPDVGPVPSFSVNNVSAQEGARGTRSSPTSRARVQETYTHRLDTTYHALLALALDGDVIDVLPQGWETDQVASFRPTQTAFPFGVTITYAYNQTELTQVTNNLGRSLHFTYYGDPNPFLLGLSHQPDGPPFVWFGGDLGGTQRLLSVADENERTVTFSNPLLDTFNVTTVDNRVISYGYHAPIIAPFGRGPSAQRPVDAADGEYAEIRLLSAVYLPRPSGAPLPSTPFLRLAYDDFGRIESITDADDNATTFGAGAETRGFARDPLGATSWSYFDDKSRLMATVDPRDRLETTRYDGIGRTIETRLRWAGEPDAQYEARSTFAYDALHSQIAACSFPRTGALGVPIGGTTLAPTDRTKCANDPDAMFGASDPGEPRVTQTEYAYAAFPTRPTRTIDSRGNATVTCYDPAQGGVCVGVPALTVNGPDGLPRGTYGPSGEEERVQYDALGRTVHIWTRVD